MRLSHRIRETEAFFIWFSIQTTTIYPFFPFIINILFLPAYELIKVLSRDEEEAVILSEIQTEIDITIPKYKTINILVYMIGLYNILFLPSRYPRVTLKNILIGFKHSAADLMVKITFLI